MMMINCYGVNDERQLTISDLHLLVNWIDVELVANAGDEVWRIFILSSTVTWTVVEVSEANKVYQLSTLL